MKPSFFLLLGALGFFTAACSVREEKVVTPAPATRAVVTPAPGTVVYTEPATTSRTTVTTVR
jgi:hypothetical protein